MPEYMRPVCSCALGRHADSVLSITRFIPMWCDTALWLHSSADYVSTKNFLDFCPKTVQRILLVSSVGVTRYNQLPYNILNLFGVLKFKRLAEELLQTSGIPYTILRPGRLTDGPYTSYDLNTLLKATSGLRKSVIINRGDSLSVETSRIAVAEAAVQALFSDSAKNEAFEIGSVEGPWPGSELGKWDDLFAKAPAV